MTPADLKARQGQRIEKTTKWILPWILSQCTIQGPAWAISTDQALPRKLVREFGKVAEVKAG